ncbi:MAG: DNA adenine methylase [Elusimicrobiota bacterium]|nr:DNA adenine methylase [Elusimicrobiota bacterium]
MNLADLAPNIIDPLAPKKRSHYVDAPFGYYGSKQRLASRIVEQLPPHNAWVEVFCGSAAVTLAKKPAPIEIINDIDSEVFNFFKQLRENGDELCRQIALTPYAREEFELARKRQLAKNGIERARRFLVSSMMTVNGTVGAAAHSGFSYSQSYVRNGKEARVNRWYTLPDKLAKVAERLRGVRVENRDARELLAMFIHRPATLAYLDPPYLMDREHGYRTDARDQEFHVELLRIACKAHCMILISGYNNHVYNSILTKEHGWTKKLIFTTTRDTRGHDHKRTEVLWKNKAFEKARKSRQIPIHLSKMEREQNKVNPARKG